MALQSHSKLYLYICISFHHLLQSFMLLKISAFFIIILAILAIAVSIKSWLHGQAQPLPNDNRYNFYVITDWGTAHHTSGAKAQVAYQMNLLAAKVHPRFIISTGDNFHDNAPKSVSDTIWKSNYTNFYDNGPISRLKWYTILGNHDHEGNIQSEIDYHSVDSNWIMPARYYTFTKTINDSTDIRFVMLDTSPFLESYWKKYDKTGEMKPFSEKELHWTDSVLSVSHERWVVVMGHHPIYNAGMFAGIGYNFKNSLEPVLRKHHVDLYFSGHVHSFQHNQMHGSDYVVTASGWQARFVTPWYFTRYCKGNDEGFTLCSVDYNDFTFYFIDKNGKELYSYSREK